MTQATRSSLMSVDTTLSANITAAQDYIPIASTANFSTSVVAEIETTNEIVSFTTLTTNNKLYSQDLTNAVWVKRGTASVTGNYGTAPDGTTTSNLLAIGTGVNDVYSYTYATAANALLAAPTSFYLKKVTTTGQLNLLNPGGTGSWQIDLSAVGSDWERITDSHAAVTVVAAFVYPASQKAGFMFRADSGTLNFEVWGCQVDDGDTSVSGYIPTTAAIASGLTGVTRGVNGTTAATASSGDAIQQLPYALLNVDMPVRLTGLSVSSDGTGAGRLTLCDKVGTHLCDVDIPDTKIFDLTFDGGIIFPNGIYVANSDNITAYTLYTSRYNSPSLTAGG